MVQHLNFYGFKKYQILPQIPMVLAAVFTEQRPFRAKTD
jgi:hypothetical protein